MNNSILSTVKGVTILGLAVLASGGPGGLGLSSSAGAQAIEYNCLTREVFTPEKQAWCDRIALQDPIHSPDPVRVPHPGSPAVRDRPVDDARLLELAQRSSPEDTLVLCEGSRRTTARVYLSQGQMQLRVYDRQDKIVWLNTDAVSEPGPAGITFQNQRGEVIVSVTLDRNSPDDCSIQVGDQPLEPGTVLARGPLPEASAPAPVLADVPSPVGGMVKQLTLPGPETSVLVACDRSGFEPFLFTDQGLWIGCQISQGAEPGPSSDLEAPTLTEVPSPVGGTVKQLTIPGPEISVLVTCGPEFEPFLFTDQGTWVGCQANP